MIGVPLEMVHGILRISFLYLAGVLAGGCMPGAGAVPITSPREGMGMCTLSLMGMQGFSCHSLLTAGYCSALPALLAPKGWGAMQPIIR